MRRSRLAPLLACALVLLALPGSGSAGTSTCGSEILAAAVQTSVSSWYSPGCYAEATRLLTPDLRTYSDVPAVITTAAHRDLLRRLQIGVARKAPGGRIRITFTPSVGSIRVSVFARRGGRFIVAAVGTLRGAGGSLKARIGTTRRIRVSAGYVGSGDAPATLTLTLKR